MCAVCQVAGLLSHVPNDVDVNSHAKKVLRRTAARRTLGGVAAAKVAPAL